MPRPDAISVEEEIPPAEFRIAPPGTTMIWKRLDGYKTEHGRIDSETWGLDNPFHARNRIWFAPAIGWNVQFQYQDSRGVSYAWQAIEFKPPVAH